MAFQSLYRKYRPQRFDEVVGQEHVVDALRAAVRDDRVGHAYLFSGPRGTGKTTTARILAKALNCLDLGDDGEPCGECENCVAIARGSFFDLFELDAASSRKLEHVQELVKMTATGMAPGSLRKVFVLDEVHAMDSHATPALLKSLEEPPEHVVYILATTNPEQVLPTIRSRTQHYEFGLLTTEELVGRLADLCAREGVDADPAALEAIANAGAGSARDSESLLDQALAHGTGHLDGDVVKALFGGTPFAARTRVLDAIASEDAADAIVALAELLDVGHEPRRVAEDLLSAARDAFVLTAAGGRIEVPSPVEDRERLAAIGETLGNAALVRVIETLGQAVTDMRGVDAADPRLVLEVALVRLSRRDAGPPIQMVVERIERLERSLGSGDAGPPVAERTRPSIPARPSVPAPEPASPGSASPAPEGDAATPVGRGARRTLGAVRSHAPAAVPDRPEASPVPTVAPTPASAPAGPAPAGGEPVPEAVGPIELDDVIVAWADVVTGLSPATRSAVQQAQPLRVEGPVLVFGVPPDLLGAAKERFKREAEIVRTALADRLGRRFKFSLEAAAQFALDGSSDSMGSSPRAPVEPTESRPSDPGASAGTPDPDGPDRDDGGEMIETDDLRDAPALDASAPVDRLRDELGATVVEEVPREA